MTLKVISISDTHNQLSKIIPIIPNGDIIIHCGDFSGTGNYKDHYTFAQEFGGLPHKYKLCTFGNHDRYSHDQLEITKQLFEEYGIISLVDEEIIIEGLKIYGSPWTPRFGNWWWMRDRGEHIAKMWQNIPYNLDILFAHGMPYGILDTTIYDNGNQGCKDLIKEIEIKKPKIVIGGHLHLNGGKSLEKDGITYYNSAICDEHYRPTNNITEFTI